MGRASDAELGHLAAAIYDTPTAFDVYESGIPAGFGDHAPPQYRFAGRNYSMANAGICYGVVHAPEETIVSFRGSLVLKDWVLDMNAFANPFVHQEFGPVHPGFLWGMAEAADKIAKLADIAKPITITGHSLGAARAAILTALLFEKSINPSCLRRVVFGEPKPGFKQLASFINPVESRSYRNGDTHEHDPVPGMPFSFPPEEYVHPRPVIEVCEPPSGPLIEKLAAFSWHHIDLYTAALDKLIVA